MVEIMADIDEIWKDAQLELDKLKVFEEVVQTNCEHINVVIDINTADEICMYCGSIVGQTLRKSVEWNNYKDGLGNYAKNTQRGDLLVDDNPYSIGGTICGMFKNNKSLAARIHLQQCFNHKQRTYWQTSNTFENICTKASLTRDVLYTAKHMWYICMESGTLTRASVRQGLIASCLYYSCVFNKVPIGRNDIIELFELTTKALSKGERVFYGIIEKNDKYRYLTKDSIDIKENDSFVKYCNMLNLEWKVAMLCNDIFQANKDKLSSVTPKSATCGVLVYVIKKKLQLKLPTKSDLSIKLNVCTPTINKVLQLLDS
jgi:transcription initiation factor TFIIIB Brf1 subunit/transcription initiation factor TFIIB